MRFLILAAVLSLPAGALAAQSPLQYDNLRAQQEAAQRQAVATANEQSALEARLRTEQAILDLENQRVTPALRVLPAPPLGATAASQVGAAPADSAYPSMPDRALADSNRQIQKIRKHRR